MPHIERTAHVSWDGNLARGAGTLDAESGAFARQWIAESQAGKPEYQRMWDEDLAQPVEQVGAELRKHMAWLRSDTPAEQRIEAQPQPKAA